MGLFDRLFGKKEEPKIEEVVKEALENLDLSEEVEENQTAIEEPNQEEAARDKVEATLALSHQPLLEPFPQLFLVQSLLLSRPEEVLLVIEMNCVSEGTERQKVH